MTEWNAAVKRDITVVTSPDFPSSQSGTSILMVGGNVSYFSDAIDSLGQMWSEFDDLTVYVQDLSQDSEVVRTLALVNSVDHIIFDISFGINPRTTTLAASLSNRSNVHIVKNIADPFLKSVLKANNKPVLSSQNAAIREILRRL